MSDLNLSNGRGVDGATEEEQVAAGPDNGYTDDHRTVMRHRIALKLDDFRATPEGFERRPKTHDRELLVESQPFFSIIIPNYNGMNLLPPLMEALDRQTFRDFEVILVDDASNDRSVAWLEEHQSDVRVIVNRRNEGFDRSCNTGAAASRGRIIVILNSDTEPEPDWL
ncbi:MAG: glycosyltransferase family 2 protein, partial [Caldilineaceae bacterium]